MSNSILEEIKKLIVDEINFPDKENPNVYISMENTGGVLTTYDKVVSKTGRIPVVGVPGKTVETIEITRTVRTNP